MYVNPGELNKRIQIILIENNSFDKDGFQAKKETLIRSCYAKKSDISGTELIRANSELSEAKIRFLVRWAKQEITTDMFVRYKGKDHDIVYVNPYGDSKEYIEIWTELSERK